MNDHRPSTRSGTILLICMSLVAAMVAIAFAYVLSMRTAAELGPSAKALGLARQSAQAGTAHACEMLLRDYLDRPLSPTSDASAHRVFFNPIDNQIPQAPGEAKAATAKEANLWNDNDVNPLSKNLNPYRRFEGHTGRTYDPSEDGGWAGNLVVSSTPRYIEPMHYSTRADVESSSGRTDFTKVPATPPEVNTPIYYDSRWQPATDRTLARYRLRYGVWCEDLSGHLFMGLPAPFTRGDPLAADGDLIAAGRNDQGTELDRAWAMRYAPQLNVMFLDFELSSHRGRLSEGGGTQAYVMPWIGTDSTFTEDLQTGGFTTAGIMLGSSPWAWRNSGNNLSGTALASPWQPLGSWIVHRFTGKRYSFQALNDITGNSGLHLGGLIVPYGSPTRWDRSPDPETVDPDTLAYNEGPTDCPWRINVLTAPANALRAVFTGFRPSYTWEHELTWKVTFLWDKWDGTTPKWKIPNPIPKTYPLITKLATAKRSQVGVPDPFRASFLSKDRVSGAVNRRPFAQFMPSPSADNPRAHMDPFYPSPVTAGYREDIGRFSDLERDGTWFRRGGGQAGPCVPRLDDTRRLPLLHSVTSFNNTYATPSMPDDTSVFKVPGKDMEAYYAFDPWNRTNADLDGDGLNDPDTWRWPRDARPKLWNSDSYLLDALSALASSAAVAIAAYQPNTPYPAEPAGGCAVFAGKWGSGPTLDADTDGDGYLDANSVITNVADIDRLFLLILGEDPAAPGGNVRTRSAVYAAMPGGSNSFTPTASYGSSPFIPRLAGLPAYAPGTRDYSTYFDSGAEQWKQCPFIGDDAAKHINLRRASLLGLRRGIYTDAEPGLHADNAATHLGDAAALKSEAASLVKGGGAYATDARTRAKHSQLMRCRLRDAERIVNDMRMSFFGANVRYLDRTRTGHPSRGRFRPYDLDGDGWAICSAYCPSDVSRVEVKDDKDGKVGYRVTEPTDWSKVVFDIHPDNPDRIDDTHGLAHTSGPVWVCFRDVDTTAAGVVLTNDTSTSDFKDLLTYSPADDAASGPFPGSSFGSVPASRSGFTRWFYPAVRVLRATDTDVIDGVAAYPPDTYFSLTGYFTLEKSRFYRMITRGEVWDEWRRLVVSSVLLETVFMLDPDGDVLRKTAAKPIPIDPATGKVKDGSGIEDSSIIYQRWLKDHFSGSRNRSAASP